MNFSRGINVQEAMLTNNNNNNIFDNAFPWFAPGEGGEEREEGDSVVKILL